jgi:hypothetical protein
MGRLRFRTLMLWVAIVALVFALWAQHKRATFREARLRSQLRVARNYANGIISNELDKPLDMPFDKGTTLAGLISHIKCSTGWVLSERSYTKRISVRQPGPLENGLLIHIDPVAMAETGVTVQAPLTISSRGVSLRDTLHDVLGPLGLAYYVRNGMLVISTKDDAEWLTREDDVSPVPE